jgi:hypothetical protein
LDIVRWWYSELLKVIENTGRCVARESDRRYGASRECKTSKKDLAHF